MNRRLETIFPALFHTARTLSGSLRSPPSPRGEGFVRRYSFSKYACIRSDVIGKAVFSFYSLYRWRSEPCFCMTAEQPLEEGARQRRRIECLEEAQLYAAV